jgi:hypothetical protein
VLNALDGTGLRNDALRMRNEFPHRGHCVTSTARPAAAKRPSASMRDWAALTRFFGFWILGLDRSRARAL